MDEEATQKLLKVITEYLGSNKENFADAVNLATKFSIENSITYDSLLNLTLSWVPLQKILIFKQNFISTETTI